MPQQIVDPTIQINDTTIGIIPNSCTYTEGLGEQKVRAVSVGEGKTEQIYAEDTETKFSMVMFEVPPTVDNLKFFRDIKTNRNLNVVALSGSTADGNFQRTFTQAALTGNYEVPLGSDTNISVEMHSNAAI